MSLDLSPADQAFRDEVRALLAEKLTADLRLAGRLCAGVYSDRPVAQRWLSILNDRGWAVPHWPREHGGTGWTPVQHHIFASELVAADAPPVSPNATHMLGPVLIAFGTPEQKARYLPAIATGEDWWAQGYSEPGSGSDLASLQTRAVRDGDDYVIDGSKIWTTHAQWSNRIFCLVRTRFEGKPQAGMSFLVFDMDLPGITIQPIITLAGDHEVNAVFFDGVRVPATALVGQEHEGWTVAKYLLKHERGGAYAPRLRRQIKGIRAMMAARAAAADLPDITRALAHLEIRLDAIDATEQRILAAIAAGREPGPESSMMKLQGTELLQQLDELVMTIAGPYAVPDEAPAVRGLDPAAAVGPQDTMTAASKFLNNRAASIYAGSNEIQRNIMAGQVLKL